MARTLTVARAGRESGSSTRQKNPNGPQPSMRAASSSSVGMLRKNGRRMTIVSGSPKAACGIATPSGLSDSPSLAEQDVQRQDRDGDREQQAEHEQRVHASRPGNRDPGEHERRERRAQRPMTTTATIATSTLLPTSPQNVSARPRTSA